MYVEIALNIPSDKLFSYEVPTELEQDIVVGKRVFVPFGNKKRTGFITDIRHSCA
jgi:primosomal protein N' (replication factor Y)